MKVITGFRKFISRGNAIDLAVGVIIGGAFGKIVTGLVESFINPFIAMLFGQPDFNQIHFVINGTNFPIGNIITAAVNFFLIAIAIYFCIVLPMNKLKEVFQEEEEKKPEITPEEILLLREIRDSLKNQK